VARWLTFYRHHAKPIATRTELAAAMPGAEIQCRTGPDYSQVARNLSQIDAQIGGNICHA